MAFELAERARHLRYRVAEFDSVGSTNAEALAYARRGDRGRLWVVAHEQTAGRGRRGSRWLGARGNLAASCLLTLDRTPALTATLGFVAGLSLHDALAEVAPGVTAEIALDGAHATAARFALKWPNDVLADGAKLSGILLESEKTGSGATAVVIGIGVNVVSSPGGLAYKTACLRDLGARCSAETLFTSLTGHWCRYETMWDEGRGLAEIREAWLRRAAGLGEPVALALAGEVTRGIFETIDGECRLVVRTDSGARVHVSAGEVHFGTAASLRGVGEEI